MKLLGIITKGESSASGEKMNWGGYGSIYHQVIFFKENNLSFFKEIMNCQMATINIEFKDEIIFLIGNIHLIKFIGYQIQIHGMKSCHLLLLLFYINKNKFKRGYIKLINHLIKIMIFLLRL